MKTNKKSLIVLILILLFAVITSACHAGRKTNTVEGQSELSDGEYTPYDFTWSGGSGRVNITCDKIAVEDGQVYAHIIFDSPYYGSAKAEDTVYKAVNTETTSEFTIPVKLNEANIIYAVNTKMSNEHEIEYTICPYLSQHGDSKETGDSKEENTDAQTDAAVISHDPPYINGITFERKLEKEYADGFDIFYYSRGYALINVYDSAAYLVVPENEPVPEGLDEDTVVLKRPLKNIYLAATSAMALFRAIGSMDDIRLTGTKASGWYIDEAREAIESGRILFAGKYSQPDYELLLDEKCGLAVESTMILHAPKVKEMLESLDIPVFIDHSSYEKHPLGRTEWIKIYGLLMDREEEAQRFFKEQSDAISGLKYIDNTEKLVVFFYMNANGNAVVRKPDDYIPWMIEAAGGRYAFRNLESNGQSSALVTLSMEEFYSTAMSADYLIYNGTAEGPLTSVDELIAKSALFAEFKAVKEGNVWTIGKDMYQSTDIVGLLIRDINHMLTGENLDDMIFVKKVPMKAETVKE